MNLNFNNLDKDKVFLTSDPHFWHSNIIKYCKRPFSNVEEMNDILIKNINDTVPADALLFIVGDFAFTGSTNAIRVLSERIIPKIVLIYGNHCHQNKLFKETKTQYFLHATERLKISIKDDEVHGGMQEIILDHYPGIVWNGSHRGTWQAFGHVHLNGEVSTSLDASYVRSRMSANQYDVGVDNNNYTPISYEELKTIITIQNIERM